jgi:hypothetical protein
LPRVVPSHFLHKVATAPGDKKVHIARFNNPITTVVKHVAFTPPAVARTPEGENGMPEGDNGMPTLPNTPFNYTQVHVTFQSTSLCNITTVNALNQNTLFVMQKECGI